MALPSHVDINIFQDPAEDDLKLAPGFFEKMKSEQQHQQQHHMPAAVLPPSLVAAAAAATQVLSYCKTKKFRSRFNFANFAVAHQLCKLMQGISPIITQKGTNPRNFTAAK